MELILVESPKKSRTLGQFLGKDFKIAATIGHIRDLPKRKIGVDIENDFKPTYKVIPGKQKVINDLKKQAKKAKQVWLSMDPDREGEAIAWHTAKALNLGKNYQRIVFHEITQSAVEQALKNPRKIDMDLVNAQQARRILDRIVGYKLSPLLWRKITRGLSAGRVQSVTLRLIVEREKEINAFVPCEYWTIEALLKKIKDGEFTALLVQKGKKKIGKFGIKNKEQADKIVKDLDGAEYKVQNIEKKQRKRSPLAPFTTSTLQQEAWQRFRFPAKMTMGVAQQLYEKGLCVDDNSLIVTKNGEIYQIKELENSPSRALTGIEEETLRPAFAKINKFWKIKAPKEMIELETEDHEKVLITKDHPLMILREGLPTWITGENIRQNDYVAALESILTERKSTPTNILQFIELFPESIRKKVEFRFAASFHKLIRRKTVKKPVHYTLLRNQLKRKRLNIKQVEKYYQGVRVKPKVGISNFHKIPFCFNTKISYLIGLIAGDGSLAKNSPKIRIAQKLENGPILCSLNKLLGDILGIPVNKFKPQRTQCTVNSTFLYHLIQLFGIPAGKKSHRIDISNILLSQPDDIVRAYLAGLWDSDGCINKHPSANSLQISYSSKSEIFINKLRLVLKTFGINSSKHFDRKTGGFWIRFTSKAIPNFKNYIAPFLIIKRPRWKKLYSKYRPLYEGRVLSQCQGLPGISPLLEDLLISHNFAKQKLSISVGLDLFNYFGKTKPEHTRLSFIQKPVLAKISTFIDTKNQLFEKLSSSPIIWKRIKTKKIINYRKTFVYDVTTSTNTFIVNGLVSHNCTYHRTDSTNLSQEALQKAKEIVLDQFGKNYWPGSSRIFKTKSKVAQEAHEAIRPTYPEKNPKKMEGELEQPQFKLYDLIWRRFIASQMSEAIFDATTVDVSAKNPVPYRTSKVSSGSGYIFRATGQILKFDGFLKVYPMRYEEAELPELKANEVLKLKKLISDQHFTQPPPRYTEASLIKELEKDGIGRPSTYASIVSVIQERNYVKKNEKKQFYPTEIGFAVSDLLVEHFPKIVNVSFTAKMEENLDKIANGKKEWTSTLKEFYDPFAENLKKKYKEIEKKVEKTEKKCPQCGSLLVVRMSRFGKFYGCSNYPKCKFTQPYDAKTYGPCPKCKKGEIVAKRTKKGKIFWGCNLWPKCDYASWEEPATENNN